MKKLSNTISWLSPSTFLPSGMFLMLTIAHVGIGLSIPAIVVLLYFELMLLSLTITHLCDNITTKKALFLLWQCLGLILLFFVGISMILHTFSIDTIGIFKLVNYSSALHQLSVMVILCISSLLPFEEMKKHFECYLSTTKQHEFTHTRFFMLQSAGIVIKTTICCLLGTILFRSISYHGIQLLSLVFGASYFAVGIHNIWILFLKE